MKTFATALGVASSVTGFLGWVEAHSRRPGAEVLAFEFKRVHVLIGVLSGIVVLVR